MSRYRSDEATVWVWDDYDRTCLRWRSRDFWHDIRQSLKAHLPRHGDLSYSPSRKLWSVPVWRRPALEEWVLWTFEPACVRWDEEPAGAYGRTYSNRSYGRYSRQQTCTTTTEDAYAHLCLTPEAPPELVRVVHHFWVKQLHPDTGAGDPARMARINAAVDAIKEGSERKAS